MGSSHYKNEPRLYRNYWCSAVRNRADSYFFDQVLRASRTYSSSARWHLALSRRSGGRFRFLGDGSGYRDAGHGWEAGRHCLSGSTELYRTDVRICNHGHLGQPPDPAICDDLRHNPCAAHSLAGRKIILLRHAIVRSPPGFFHH